GLAAHHRAIGRDDGARGRWRHHRRHRPRHAHRLRAAGHAHRGRPVRQRGAVLGGLRAPRHARGGLHGTHPRRGRVPRRDRRDGRRFVPPEQRGGREMSTGAIAPYRSGQQPGRDDFPHLLRAEWTKFRTVRGWVIAMVAAALLTALAVVALAGVSNGSQNAGANPAVAIGPGGEAVTDDSYFVHQSLDGNGSITARLASLDTELANAGSPPPHIAVPWAKAGIIIKASSKPGSAY